MPDESIGTAEEALAAILDTATRIPGSTGTEVIRGSQRIADLVRVALADLHNRPQGATVLDLPFPDPVRELALDYAVKVADRSIRPTTGEDIGRVAEAFARFLAGGPIDG